VNKKMAATEMFLDSGRSPSTALRNRPSWPESKLGVGGCEWKPPGDGRVGRVILLSSLTATRIFGTWERMIVEALDYQRTKWRRTTVFRLKEADAGFSARRRISP
jgi:hypothetical protein